jgi:hypothetical protein
MKPSRRKIALAVCKKVLELMNTPRRELLDDIILKKAFETMADAKAIEVEIIDWRNAAINFLNYDAIVVTSTWDLHLYPEEFTLWLDRCEADGKKRLINDSEILKLGIKKHAYLQLLLEHFNQQHLEMGSVIPTIFVGTDEKQNTDEKFSTLLKRLITLNPEVWSGNVVIKPNTSADGDNTFVLTHEEALVKKDPKNYRLFKDADKMFGEMLKIKKYNGLMIQPFMKAVEQYGEYQLVFFNQQCHHATVKPAGFKNSSPLGRIPIDLKALPKNMLVFAENIMKFLNSKYPRRITRARVDLFAGEKGPIVCEVEMVEPNTNINRLEISQQIKAATVFANAILARMDYLTLASAFNPTLFSPKRKLPPSTPPPGSSDMLRSKL